MPVDKVQFFNFSVFAYLVSYHCFCMFLSSFLQSFFFLGSYWVRHRTCALQVCFVGRSGRTDKDESTMESGLPFSLVCRVEKRKEQGMDGLCPTSPTIFHPPKMGEKEEKMA
jgi:hypothetical protein